jgi:pilus assembly protein CpaB
MNRNALLIAVAFAVAGAGLLLVYKQRFEREAAGGKMIPVLTAVKPVQVGSKLTRDALAVRGIPEAYVETRHVHVRDLESVIGTRVSEALHSGHAVLWSSIASGMSKSRTLAELVDKGMRAISIQGRNTAPSQLLKPGDRVDAFVSTTVNRSNAETYLVAQNLLVLAVDTNLGDPEHRADKRPRGEIMLAVTPLEGQKLMMAMQQGSIQLLVRNPDDDEVIVELPSTKLSEILPKDLLARMENEEDGRETQTLIDALVEESMKRADALGSDSQRRQLKARQNAKKHEDP